MPSKEGAPGMSPVVEERLAEIEQLCREHHVERLELFGSAASGAFRPGESDLDFLVTFEASPDGRGLVTYLGLVSGLEELFGVHVDLVEEETIRNPYFRQAVDTGPRVRLYESPTVPERRRAAVPHPAPECSPVQLRTKKYLYDINQAAGNVMEFTAGKTLADCEGDLMLRLAVERAFEIIGIAVAQLTKRDATAAARLGDYQRIISMRNVIAHQYYELDHPRMWEIIERDVPALRREAGVLLGGSDD